MFEQQELTFVLLGQIKPKIYGNQAAFNLQNKTG